MTSLKLINPLSAVAILAASSVSAEEYSTAFSKKPFGPATKKLPGVVSPKLDFGAYIAPLNGEPQLHVYIRNGKHKMGAQTITLNNADSPSELEVQRVLIAKPLSVISTQPDGTHVFDTFTNEDKVYDITYQIQDGSLVETITLTSK